jgi:NADPH-dependent ferric siderophore reductase
MTDDTATAARPERRDNEALAERLGVLALSLRVARAKDLTPSCRRIELSGEDLAALEPQPGQDLMVFIDGEGARVRRRRYTIRHFDRHDRRVDLDVAMHGDGPGMRWAATVQAGQAVEAIGPRGKIGLDPDADWHFFLGDDAFAPAALTMAEAVPEDGLVVLALEIDGSGHEQPNEIAAAVIGPRWVERAGREPGDPGGLLEALSATPLPGGRGHPYVGGEHAVVNRLRDALVERGMPLESVSFKSYWRRGQQNKANGEPDRD